jgi:hypothetical protein
MVYCFISNKFCWKQHFFEFIIRGTLQIETNNGATFWLEIDLNGKNERIRMKTIGTLLCILLIFSSSYSLKGGKLDDKTKINEQSLMISSNPVNNYLEVNIDRRLSNDKDTITNLSGFLVQVINQKGILVYSSTKNIYQFSIFTGGLPNGPYEISCQVGTMVLKRSFMVKH